MTGKELRERLLDAGGRAAFTIVEARGGQVAYDRVTVLGAHVPVSSWSVLVLVVGVAAATVTYRRLASRAGWRWRPTFAALLALATALAFTITPDTGTIGVSGTIGMDGCLPDNAAQLLLDPFHDSGGIAGGTLNLLLFLPLGLTAVLATLRWPVPVTLVLLLPPAVEVAQSWIPGRYCAASDIVANVVGGMVGVLVGVTWIHLGAPRGTRTRMAAGGR